MRGTTETEKVRQGETRPWVRRILIVSTTIAAIVLLATLFAQ